jgi:dTDP-glucose 4,6-dehydratase
MNKNIIVTGGLGFIGSHLVKLLIKKGFFVIIIDNYSYSSNLDNLKNIKKNYKIFKKDICDKKIKNIFNKFKPIGIFNLAAETHVDRSIDDPKNFIFSNFVGVYNLLETSKKYLLKNKIKNFKFVHISTDEVYGDIDVNKFSNENDPLKPNSPYAASKGASDLLVRSYFKTYKFPAIITNCTNNYGPNQFPEKLLPKMILNIIDNKNLPIYGNGKNEREWIYVEDHCLALLKVFNKGKLGENYNIGSGKIYNNNIIISLILKKMKILGYGKKSRIEYVRDRPAHDKRYALNSNKIKKTLSWKPKYKFNYGLDLTINWYLKNQKWIKNLSKKDYQKRKGLKID